MNVVKEIERINAKELELGGSSSWHDDYKDSAYIYVGGLDYELTEGDVVTIFSQFGEVADVNMPRDKKTGKIKGFAFLMYEDQRSTVLAVDNLSGTTVVGRTLRVDHVKKYKQLEQDEEGKYKEREEQSLNALPENFQQEEEGSASDASSHPSIDPDDPMAAYLLDQARSGKKSKKRRHNNHEGETKEERRARKAEKKRRKAEKAATKGSSRPERSPPPRSRRRDSDEGDGKTRGRDVDQRGDVAARHRREHSPEDRHYSSRNRRDASGERYSRDRDSRYHDDDRFDTSRDRERY